MFTGDFGNAFFSILIFVGFVWILARFARRPVISALVNRERSIRDSLETASQERQLAGQRLRESQERLERAGEEAAAIIEQAKKKVEIHKRLMEEETRRNMEMVRQRMSREIAMARDSAIRELFDQTAELAITIATGIVLRQITPADHVRLVSEAIGAIAEQGDGQGSARGGESIAAAGPDTEARAPAGPTFEVQP